MDEDDLEPRLSRITTRWSVVLQAHQGEPDAVGPAQRQLLQRYGGAVYRYLLGALRDPDAADELSQEFSLRFVRGDFRRAAPERGRFRDYVKTALFHLIVDYQKRRRNQPGRLPESGLEPAAPEPEVRESDAEFLNGWRDELLARAWEALERVERQTGQPFHSVLRFRAENPGLSSAQMAQQLGERLQRSLTADSVRQTLHRARERFAALLLDEVSCSLETSDQDRLEQELIDLGLLAYCRSALQRHGSK